jgi:Transcription factor S-II (TFIIS)
MLQTILLWVIHLLKSISVQCVVIPCGAQTVELLLWKILGLRIAPMTEQMPGPFRDSSAKPSFSKALTDCWFEPQQLPRAVKLCPKCGESEAVYFQSQQRAADTGMVGIYETPLVFVDMLIHFTETLLCLYILQPCLYCAVNVGLLLLFGALVER